MARVPNSLPPRLWEPVSEAVLKQGRLRTGKLFMVNYKYEDHPERSLPVTDNTGFLR
jgi:hypothetical protein